MRLAHLDESWNKPNRTDHYLMQVACEVYNVLRRTRMTDVDKFKIKFGVVKQEKITHENAPERARKSKSFWAPLMGLARVFTKDPVTGEVREKENGRQRN